MDFGIGIGKARKDITMAVPVPFHSRGSTAVSFPNKFKPFLWIWIRNVHDQFLSIQLLAF
jgi:hypothetical protein